MGIFGILIKFLGLILGSLYIPIPLIIFLFLDVIFLNNLLRKRVRKPAITERIEKIWLTCFLGIVVTFIAFYFFFSNALILGEVLLIITPYVGIIWTIPIVSKIKQQEIKKAEEVLAQVKPTVIGITGSYGKTTTKEFVAHLLSQKYKIAKTEGSENTEFGIARKTYKNVKKGTQYFVVEMGAYKMGEINKLASIVSPSVGIITGLEPQHLSLFGTFENIKKAKFELIDALPESGLAFFNVSNLHVRKLLEKAKKLDKNLRIFSYVLSSAGTKGINADMMSKVVGVNENGIMFEVLDGRERRKFVTPLHGVHFIENLTGAILVARIFGVTWREIEKGVSTLDSPDHVMQVYKLKNNKIIIDDSYNSTPTGFKSALKYLFLFKGKKKIVITPGIIELGEIYQEVHTNLGKLMSGIVDQTILLNEDPLKSIKKGNKITSLSVIKNSRKVVELLRNVKDAAILLEGRQPVSVMKYLDKEKNV